MKRLIVLTAAVLILTPTLAFSHCGICGVGEAKGSKGSMGDDWMKTKMETMTKELGLTEDQAKEVEALMKAKMEKKKAVYEEKHGKIEAIRDEYKANLKSVLTDEQFTKYESMKQEKGSAHEHKGSGHEHKGSQ